MSIRMRTISVCLESIPEVVTTGQIARLLQVSSVTVRAWADSGELPAMRLPGTSKPRRVMRDDLIGFLHRMGVGVQDLRARREALLVGLPVSLADDLRTQLPDGYLSRLRGWQMAFSLGEAGVILGRSSRYDLAIFDFGSLGRSASIEFVRSVLRQDQRLRHVRIIGLASEDEGESRSLVDSRTLFDVILKRPFSAESLAEKVVELEGATRQVAGEEKGEG